MHCTPCDFRIPLRVLGVPTRSDFSFFEHRDEHPTAIELVERARVDGNIHSILIDGTKRLTGWERGLGDRRSAWASRIFLRFTKVGDAGRSGSVRFRLVLGIVARIPGRRAAVKPVLNLLLYQFRRSPAYLPRLTVDPFSVQVLDRWWIFLCSFLLAVVEL